MLTYRLRLFILIIVLAGCTDSAQDLPDFITGSFQDDYNISYQISEDLWFQKPDARYHIVHWDLEKQFLVARNDSANPSQAGLYTRFDWMRFDDMPPYTWGHCMTVYDAESIEEAKQVTSPDRKNPKKGCNGFPFSRMQKTN
ncbi:MAG: hypothetical protein FH748_16170 [Balneolaceae bacterium]|nr:hypothetical protein [Balneolaceae bacterium]